MRLTPLSTHLLIKQWANWGGMTNLGYPKISPMFVERCQKSRLYPIGYIPPDVIDIERAMKALSEEERKLMIKRYLWGETYREIGSWLNCTHWKARHKVEDAEYDLHIAYCRLGA